ncbi:MAG TPA: lipocalin family protein [Caulobacteraceae bacterium]|jgi:apolipoprotein D and lipocalin family protein
MAARALCLLFLVVASPAIARAGAPPPAKPVAESLYSGRWYEIARTPNSVQRACEGATSDFQNYSDGAFSVVDTCHEGSPAGPAKVLKAHAKMIAGSENTRFRMAFFGGLVHQEYWILDHADNGDWAIMATPGGRYAWLLARRAVLPPAEMSAAMARLRQLGYERLIFPQQG